MKTILLALACVASLAQAGPVSNGNFDGTSVSPWTVNSGSRIALSNCAAASGTSFTCTSTNGLIAGMRLSGSGLVTSPAGAQLYIASVTNTTTCAVSGGTIATCPAALTASNAVPVPTLQVTRTTATFAPNSSPYSLRVDGRDSAMDGPKQSVLTGLTNGARYTTRFSIKLDAPAQVRCLVSFGGLQNVPPILLAETVVRTAQTGQWISVQGTNVVSWTGAPTGAQIYFAVEQLYPLGTPSPAGVFPGYNLDAMGMEVDTDGDGLWDTEEVPGNTNPQLADTDTDRMPDQWETDHGLKPLENDAALDADGDGYTNLQEYWANTNPQNANEHPGMPSDPLATPQTRALLRYLAVLPSRTGAHLLDGQEASFASVNDYGNYVVGLANAMQSATGTARWPAVAGFFCEQISQNGAMEVLLNGPLARSYIDAGGLVIMSWSPRNPWNGNFIGDKTGVDIANLLTPGTTANVRYTGWMDTIAAELAQFGPDRPFVFRILSEMNGGWDWYGHLTQADFIALWRWTRDYFVLTKGLHNILWAYEPVVSAHSPTSLTNAGYSMDYYWPGDDAVDLIGYSLYTKNWDAPFDPDGQSRLHPKAIAIAEGGPPTADAAAANDYNTRYVPMCAAKYPRAAFFVIFNSFPVWNQQTQTSSHNYIAIIDNPNYVELLTDPAVVNRESVHWRAPSGLAAGAPSASQFSLSWAPAAGATGYRVEVSIDGLHGWALAAAPGITSATVGGYAPSTTRFFRVRALYPDGDSDTTDAFSATTCTAAEGWCAAHLGNANAPMLGDTDRDGLVELVEYALGLDPLAPAAAGPIRSTVNIGGSDYLAITFTRDLTAADVTVTVQSSTDLSTWHDGSSYGPGGIVTGNAFTTEVSRIGSGSFETITVRANVPISTGALFLRLKVAI
jgi:hypothetical protein